MFADSGCPAVKSVENTGAIDENQPQFLARRYPDPEVRRIKQSM